MKYSVTQMENIIEILITDLLRPKEKYPIQKTGFLEIIQRPPQKN